MLGSAILYNEGGAPDRIRTSINLRAREYLAIRVTGASAKGSRYRLLPLYSFRKWRDTLIVNSEAYRTRAVAHFRHDAVYAWLGKYDVYGQRKNGTLFGSRE